MFTDFSPPVSGGGELSLADQMLVNSLFEDRPSDDALYTLPEKWRRMVSHGETDIWPFFEALLARGRAEFALDRGASLKSSYPSDPYALPGITENPFGEFEESRFFVSKLKPPVVSSLPFPRKNTPSLLASPVPYRSGPINIFKDKFDRKKQETSTSDSSDSASKSVQRHCKKRRRTKKLRVASATTTTTTIGESVKQEKLFALLTKTYVPPSVMEIIVPPPLASVVDPRPGDSQIVRKTRAQANAHALELLNNQTAILADCAWDYRRPLLLDLGQLLPAVPRPGAVPLKRVHRKRTYFTIREAMVQLGVTTGTATLEKLRPVALMLVECPMLNRVFRERIISLPSVYQLKQLFEVHRFRAIESRLIVTWEQMLCTAATQWSMYALKK